MQSEKVAYFSVFDEQEMRGLYDFYRVDFDLFEYSAEGYRPPQSHGSQLDSAVKITEKNNTPHGNYL